MRSTSRILSWMIAMSLLWAGGAGAAPITYFASLSGANENPAVTTLGSGTALVIYDDASHTLEVSLSFADLTGTTTVAHLHCCVDEPGNAAVATFPGTFPGFPIGVTSGTYLGTWSLAEASSFTASFLTLGGGTAAGAEALLAAELAAGRAYVNVHTTFAPAGEIRGFLTAVPEPTGAALFAVGAGVLFARRRSRPRR